MASAMRPVTLLILVLVLSACTTLTQSGPGLPDAIDQAGRAYQDAAARLPPDKLEPYEKALVEAGLKLAGDQARHAHWYAAVQAVQRALRFLPDNPQLRKTYTELEQARQRRLQQSRDKLLVAEARYELAVRQHAREMHNLTAQSVHNRWREWQATRKLTELAEPLKTCAQQELKLGALELAQRCIALARQLRGEDFVKAEQATLKHQLQDRNEAAIPLKQDNSEKLRKAAIVARIASLRKLADENYRKQQYREAKAAWMQILELDPDDARARVMLERVDRIIKNLDSLRKDQGANSR